MLTERPPEGSRVVYVGPERPDIPEPRGVVVLDPTDNPRRAHVSFGNAIMSIALSDLVMESTYDDVAGVVGEPDDDFSGEDGPSAGDEVDPFVFREWLLRNSSMDEDQVGLNFLNRFFREFKVTLRGDES